MFDRITRNLRPTHWLLKILSLNLHDQAVERYYGLDDLYTRIALTSVLLAFWVIGGTGTVALWITPAQLWAEVFLKIASITCFVIILIITIFIYLKYRFVD